MAIPGLHPAAPTGLIRRPSTSYRGGFCMGSAFPNPPRLKFPTAADCSLAARATIGRDGDTEVVGSDGDGRPFKPTAGGVRVETWIAKVDLAVEGARISGRGDWNDEELYYVVGNKSQDDAAKSWVQINKELVGHERTWSKLKEALVYETRRDRTVFGKRETLLGQFYRGLENTTRQLVKLAPTPTTLGEAVDKATKIDDSSYNVARSMRNIGQPWATSTTQTAIQMDGTTGAMRVIPGIGSMPADMMGDLTVGGNEVGEEHATWNGKFWRLNKKELKAATFDQRATNKRHAGKPERKVKVMVVTADQTSSSEESDAPPPAKKKKRGASVRQAKASERAPDAPPARPAGAPGKQPNEMNRCFACGGAGHFARECPDTAAKARNDAYLAERKSKLESAENGNRA
ncbi:hypothetical protein PR003_g16476 [Phytophthora rubi]|uniref:CCHC-type domain-containing protein n=1 Tax=Phytophthora rubi TaxID=129364 RepID=A0A6A4EKB4_9STRA|nr:hypothetical protein PR003_g16476 [Phytophthora rubi]